MALSYTSILAGASGQSSGYSISNSARFVSGNSCELVFAPGVASTSQRKLTYSVWVKRVKLGVRTGIIRGGTQDGLRWDVGDTLSIFVEQGVSFGITTTALFRDTSAWYHIFAVIDTTNATTADRMQLWVNGVRQAVTGTCPTLNYDLIYFNKTGVNQAIGYNSVGIGTYADYYLSNFYGIDGQALTPSSFGQTNTSGVWVPKAYSGTYGTNGFLMEFKNSAALGTDTSGKGNTFTSSGLVAGDQMTDTPTLNFPVFNALNKGSDYTLSSGNLIYTTGGLGTHSNLIGSMAFTTKTYFEFEGVTSARQVIGVSNSTMTLTENPSTSANCWAFATMDGTKVGGGATYAAYGSAVSVGTRIAVAVDPVNSKIWVGTISAGVTTWFASGNPVAGTNAMFTNVGTSVFVFVNNYGSGTVHGGNLYHGAGGFSGTPPTGFVALNSSNLPAPAIKDGSAHYQASLYTGTGATKTVTQYGNSTFQPGWVIFRQRDAVRDWLNHDEVRGVQKRLYFNNTNAEDTNANALTAFNSNGFDVGSSTECNASGGSMIAWQFKAGGNSGVSNTNGSITSTISANPTAGFSIVTYTGNGTAGATIGHGLGIAPSLIIVKQRGSAGNNWPVYHLSLGATKYLELNTTIAAATATNRWNNTAPGSSVFTVGDTTAINSNGSTYVAYCFAPISGFSAFGSYTGNGSADGPFIYTGFKPAWVLIKRTDSASHDWVLYDTVRSTYNLVTLDLSSNSTAVEDQVGADIDILSNGFKLRATSVYGNASGGTYIYTAFASNPFGGAGVSPATAR